MTFGEALDAGNFWYGAVCVDCLMVVANGEDPADSVPGYARESDTVTRRHQRRGTMARYDVTLGHLHGGTYAAPGCFHAGEDCGDDCECDRADYATSPCALCGSPLAGARYDAIMVDRAVLS